MTAQTISDLGGLEGIVLSGNAHFTDAALTGELESDAQVYLQNIPDAPAGDFYQLVAGRLKAGYLACGFPDVKGEISVEGQKVLIHIDEGKRFFNGDVSFSNLDDLPDTLDLDWLAARIRRGLSDAEDISLGTGTNGRNNSRMTDLFVEGEFTNFDPAREKVIVELIEQILRTRGFQAEAVATELLREADLANLMVRFPKGIFPVTIERFDIRGVDEAGLTKFVQGILAVYQGRDANSATLNALEEQLLSTFQFSYCEVAFEASADSRSEVSAVVQVVPWLHAPAIDGPTPKEEYAMRAAVDLREMLDSEAELTVSFSQLREDGSIAESLSFGRDAGRFAFEAQQALPSGGLSARRSFLFDQSQLEAYLNNPVVDISIGFRIGGDPAPTSERQFEFTFNGNFEAASGASSEDALTLQVSSVALADKILRLGTEIKFTEITNEDGSVWVTWFHPDSKVEARFNAMSSRLDQIRIFANEEGETHMWAIERKADWIDTIEAKADLDALASVLNTAVFLMLDEATETKIAALLGGSDGPESARESINLLLKAALEVTRANLRAGELVGGAKEDAFRIPVDLSQGEQILFLQAALDLHQSIVGKLKGSSLHSYPLDFGNIAFRRPFVVVPELIRRSESGEVGPLVLALYASTLDYFNQPYVELVAEMALKQMNDEAIGRELPEFVRVAKQLLQEHSNDSDSSVGLDSANAPSNLKDGLSGLNAESLTDWLKAEQRKDQLITYLEKLTINPGTSATPGYSELAAHHYRQAIELGYESAAIRLGHIYQSGNGVPKDEARARELFSEPAAAGNAWALSSLGYLWEMGRGGEKDVSIAAEYYQKAAEGGNAYAQCNLGQFYQDGCGVEQDQATANMWFEKAAAQAHARAQMKLGYNYMTGQGLPQDDVRAAELFTESAEKGNRYARANLGMLYDQGRGVTQDYARAVDLYTKAAKQGDYWSANRLGQIYWLGLGGEVDAEAAARYFRSAVDGGFEWAKPSLGCFYEYGLGVPQDYEEALRLYQSTGGRATWIGKARIAGMRARGKGMTKDAEAAFETYRVLLETEESAWLMAHLARAYAYGVGTQQDADEAMRWIQVSVEEEDCCGFAFMGDFHRDGIGVAQDYEKAGRWYQKAMEESCQFGYLGMGGLYEKGLGVELGIGSAVNAYKKAASIGNDEAMAALERLERNVQLIK